MKHMTVIQMMDEWHARAEHVVEQLKRDTDIGEWHPNVLAEAVAVIATALRAEHEWRPIETGPKDGSRVLLFNPDEMGDWRVQSGAYDELLEGWQYDGCDPRYARIHLPTHWMPLPAPPGAQP